MKRTIAILGLTILSACGGSAPVTVEAPVVIPELPGAVFTGFNEFGGPTYVSANPVLFIGVASASGSH